MAAGVQLRLVQHHEERWWCQSSCVLPTSYAAVRADPWLEERCHCGQQIEGVEASSDLRSSWQAPLSTIPGVTGYIGRPHTLTHEFLHDVGLFAATSAFSQITFTVELSLRRRGWISTCLLLDAKKSSVDVEAVFHSMIARWPNDRKTEYSVFIRYSR